MTKNQLAGKFGPGGAFDQALPGNTPVFGLVNYKVPADAGGDAPQNTYDMIARADYNWTDKTTAVLPLRTGRSVALPGLGFEQSVCSVQRRVSLSWTTPTWAH